MYKGTERNGNAFQYMTLYRQELIERYRFPRFKGVMKNADAQGEVANMLCGDEITLFLKLDSKREKIGQLQYAGEGCALMNASADILCEHIKGKTLQEADTFSAEEMIQLYGEPPTPTRLKCVLLSYEALCRVLRSIA